MSDDGSGFSVTYEDGSDRFDDVAASGRERARFRWPVVRRPSWRVLVPFAILATAVVVGGGLGIARLTGAADLPNGFTGVWEGTVVQQTGWPARLDLTRGDVGEVIGTSRYTEQACSGRLTLKSVSGRTATVAEHITRQDAAETGCIEDVVITLELTPAGTLRYSGTAGGGFAGTLTRLSANAAVDALGVVSVAAVQAGDCFSTSPVETPLNRVSCAGPHAAEAVTKIDMSGRNYEAAASERGTGCLYPGEIDLSGASMPLKAAAQIPSLDEWEAGAQFAICLVGTEDGSPLTGRL